MTLEIDREQLKSHINGQVTFDYYQHGVFWYQCDDSFRFQVPVGETGDACFPLKDKAILYMRWIRKQMEMLKTARAAQEEI